MGPKNPFLKSCLGNSDPGNHWSQFMLLLIFISSEMIESSLVNLEIEFMK